jgi:hypothetical protein
MWALVVLSTFHYSSNIALHHIDGFASERACTNAGERVIGIPHSTYGEIKFACVWKGDEK